MKFKRKVGLEWIHEGVGERQWWSSGTEMTLGRVTVKGNRKLRLWLDVVESQGKVFVIGI